MKLIKLSPWSTNTRTQFHRIEFCFRTFPFYLFLLLLSHPFDASSIQHSFRAWISSILHVYIKYRLYQVYWDRILVALVVFLFYGHCWKLKWIYTPHGASIFAFLLLYVKFTRKRFIPFWSAVIDVMCASLELSFLAIYRECLMLAILCWYCKIWVKSFEYLAQMLAVDWPNRWRHIYKGSTFTQYLR